MGKKDDKREKNIYIVNELSYPSVIETINIKWASLRKNYNRARALWNEFIHGVRVTQAAVKEGWASQAYESAEAEETKGNTILSRRSRGMGFIKMVDR